MEKRWISNGKIQMIHFLQQSFLLPIAVKVSYFLLCSSDAILLLVSNRLWEKGHTVIGVEVARKALEEFFKEHSINYTVSPLPNGEGEVFMVGPVLNFDAIIYDW